MWALFLKHTINTRNATISSADLHESTLNTLGRAIVFGAFGEGTVLRMEELERRYGVSRSVVREAVRALASMNMVRSKRRVGVTVADRRDWNLFDPRIIRWRLEGDERVPQLMSLSELRAGVEPLAAALAAERADPQQCAALTAAVLGMVSTGRSGDLDTYLIHDIDFHRTLLKASGNEMFAHLSTLVAEMLTGRTHHHLMPQHPELLAIRLHVTVAEAVQAGDPLRAREAMSAILEEASEAVVKIAHEHESGVAL